MHLILAFFKRKSENKLGETKYFRDKPLALDIDG
jgi:hypothetical protein